MPQFLRMSRGSNEKEIPVSTHHMDVIKCLYTDKEFYTWTLTKLGTGMRLSASEVLALFPFEKVSRLPALDYAVTSALGAIDWTPRALLRNAAEILFLRWEQSEFTYATALQVRACLDCGGVMPEVIVGKNVVCDLAMFEKEDILSINNGTISQIGRLSRPFVYLTTV